MGTKPPSETSSVNIALIVVSSSASGLRLGSRLIFLQFSQGVLLIGSVYFAESMS